MTSGTLAGILVPNMVATEESESTSNFHY